MAGFTHSVLLYNAEAGASTLEAVMGLAVPQLAASSKTLELIKTDSPEELESVCRAAAGRADALFIAGGDGTVHLAARALSTIDDPPPLGILPSGTCNDFARTMNIPLYLDEAAISLSQGKLQQVDTATINEGTFLNFAGIGLITNASFNIDPDLKERYGKLSYFMSAMQTMRQAEPFDVSLSIDGQAYEEEAVLVLVMNGKSIGTHLFPMQSIDPADGLLDIFIIQSSSFAAIREWFSLSKPDLPAEGLEHIIHLQGREIDIHTDAPMDIDTDGEVYMKTPASIRVQPGKLNLLVPDEEDIFT
ncbi:diacylglycerol/lipid kinase family protein [Planococcus maitriensis]|uniref:Diacylglycerol kinase family lipid kinase n=1 Tax=Planococcus maitriensis TaxID=221799 RepID=A0A365K9G0_9BACL|nr:diacylglycerol kinase family protein [Planococcus maitriensis]RAZ69416.1 diacylglycerol kinase family lipid kinase [Planococcus maitriensis]